MDNWPDPLQLLEIRDAVRKNAPQVDLDGKKFNIDYKENGFWISPVHGFAPCGEFNGKTAFQEIE
jgi:hypothetical protein